VLTQQTTDPTPPQEDKAATDVVIKAYKQMLTSLFIGTLLALAIGFLLFYPFLRDYFILHKENPSDPPLVATAHCPGY
jgi:hypothetical protein